MHTNTTIAARNQVFVDHLVNIVLVRPARLGYAPELWRWAQGEPVALPKAA